MGILPKHTAGHKGDCHKVFDGENYLEWWKNQLPQNLIQPSIIYVNNVKYYLGLGFHILKQSKIKKQEAVYFLEEKCILFDSGMTAVEMKQLVRSYISEYKKPEIKFQAERAGHEVQSMLPYCSDVQSVKLAQAYIKRKAGRQYSIDTIYYKLFTKN